MTSGTSNPFTALNEAEKRSKLRQLGRAKGQLTLWRRGETARPNFRVKDYDLKRGVLTVHAEEGVGTTAGEMLASFELKGMSFFFKAQLTTTSGDWELNPTGEFFKSERRRNFRLLTFPVHEVHLSLTPPPREGGEVVDIFRKPGQTGLFKRFLGLVGADEGKEGIRLRVQDLSVTGLSALCGPAELELLQAGVELRDAHLVLPGETFELPPTKVVYVVDQIGQSKSGKSYKAGLHFGPLPVEMEERLGARINALLRLTDPNKDFEDFVT